MLTFIHESCVDSRVNIDFDIGGQKCKADVWIWVADLLKHCGLDGNQGEECRAVIISWLVDQQEINRFQLL